MSLKVVLITIGVLLFGLLVFLPFIFSERLVSPAAPDQNGVGVYKSVDGGKSWRVQKWFPDGIIKLIGNPADGANYFALTSHGEMFRAYDRGVSWARLRSEE